MNGKKAPFITFEGGEGSGKTTQVEILYRRLLQGEIDVVSYREPGGTKGAEHIRNLLMDGDGDRWTAKSEALLLSAARSDLVEKKILPQLEKGRWVICDRFTDSTIAYQGYGHDLGHKRIEDLNNFTVDGLKPDLTFVFQINPEIGLKRASLRERGLTDRFEKFDLHYHRRVAEGYAAVLKNNPDRCVAINSLLDIEIISKHIFEEVGRRFNLSWLK